MPIQFISIWGIENLSVVAEKWLGKLNCAVVALLHLQNFFEVACHECGNASKNGSRIPWSCIRVLKMNDLQRLLLGDQIMHCSFQQGKNTKAQLEMKYEFTDVKVNI